MMTQPMLLRDEGYGDLRVVETRGFGAEQTLVSRIALEDSSLFQTMAIEQQPVFIANTWLDPRFNELRRLGWRDGSWIGAPLLVDNELVGVLAISAREPDSYDEESPPRYFYRCHSSQSGNSECTIV
jgi:GAF sensor signal transduction histidine kinase (EC 2.7.3.-)